MTWSIVARDPETGLFGVAVATRLFAAGALCPWTEAKVGALATQALVNPSLGPCGLALLREGYPAPAALDLRADDHAEPLVELRRLYGVAPQHAEGVPVVATRP